MEEVPRRTSLACVSLFCTLLDMGGNRSAFRLSGKGGDHFHCAVEPSPGHIWCRLVLRSVVVVLKSAPAEGQQQQQQLKTTSEVTSKLSWCGRASVL